MRLFVTVQNNRAGTNESRVQHLKGRVLVTAILLGTLGAVMVGPFLREYFEDEEAVA